MKVILQGYRSGLVVTQGYLSGEAAEVALIMTTQSARTGGTFRADLRGLTSAETRTRSLGGRA